MRIEKEYPENMLRSDIYIEKEMFDLSMKIRILATYLREKSENNKEYEKFVYELEKISTELSDTRINYVRLFK